MKRFEVTIGYVECYPIQANNEVAAEEIAKEIFSKRAPHELEITVKETKNAKSHR